MYLAIESNDKSNTPVNLRNSRAQILDQHQNNIEFQSIDNGSKYENKSIIKGSKSELQSNTNSINFNYNNKAHNSSKKITFLDNHDVNAAAIANNINNQEPPKPSISDNALNHTASINNEDTKMTTENNNKSKNPNFLDQNVDLKKKKELLESKLKEQKMKKRYEEVLFPSIKDRIKHTESHFSGINSKTNINNDTSKNFSSVVSKEKQYNTYKSEAEEIGDKILNEKPVVVKKKKSKPIAFKE